MSEETATDGVEWKIGRIYYGPEYGEGSLAVCVDDGHGDLEIRLSELASEPPVLLMLTGYHAGYFVSPANPEHWHGGLKAPDDLLSDTLLQLRQASTHA